MNLKLQNIKNIFKNVKTRSIVIATMLILLVGFLFGFKYLIKNPATDNTIQIKDVPSSIESVPGGVDKSPSAEYQRLQQQQNLQQAAVAEKTGESAIPTILNSSEFGNLQHDQSAGCTSSCNPCACCESNPCAANKALNSTNSPLQPSDLKRGTLAYDLQGNVIGSLGPDGKVRDKNGKIIGEVGPDGLVRSLDGEVIGSAAVPGADDPVYDATGHLIGHVGADGKVRDAEGHVIGVVGADGTVRDLKGAVIGKADRSKLKTAKLGSGIIPGAPVYDAAGKIIGTVGADGKVRDAEGKVIGTIGPDGIVRDLNNEVLGKVGATAPGTPVYDKQGRLVGTVGNDGIVRDSRGRAIATMSADGIARDAQGNPLGSTTPPALSQAANRDLANKATSVNLLPNPDNDANPALQAILDRQAQQISAQKAEQLQQQIQSAMSTQASQLFSTAWVSPQQQYVAGIPVENKALNSENGTNGSAIGSASGGLPPAVKAGTIMYAVLLTAVNSDEPGPVLAEIVEGKFKGARLIGALTNLTQKVLLSFNLLTLPKVAQSIPIKTVAIDGNTARTALSSYTNNHYLLRYGTLFASAFLQGYADSFTAVQPIVSLVPARVPDLTPKQRIFVGLGKVGSQYASILGSVFTTPPTVHVYSGTPIGILFTEDLPALPQ